MIRKTTVAALVLSAVPAALALSLFSGTAQADDDTPWGGGLSASDDDTPWGKTITLPIPPHNDTPWDDDTPWG